MKIKKIIVLMLLGASTTLIGCSGGGSSSNTENDGGTGRNDRAGVLGTIDLFDIESRFTPSAESATKSALSGIQQCSSDNKVCITSPFSTVGGLTYLGLGGVKSWVSPQQVFTYTVKFNAAVKNFALSDVIGDLNSANRVNGKITQVDTSNCDALNGQIGTCRVGFIYSGDDLDSDDVLNINFTFKWDGDSVTVVQPTQNVPYSVQAIPALSTLGGSIISQNDSSIIVNAASTDLEYKDELSFSQSYQNKGVAPIIGVMGWPSIDLNLAVTHRFSSDPLSVFYTDGLVTDCEDGNVAVGSTCSAALKYGFTVQTVVDPATGLQRQTFKTQHNFLTALYSNGLEESFPYLQQLVISTGDFKGMPNDRTFLYSALGTDERIYVHRAVYGDLNEFLSYAPMESEISFELRYEPNYYVGSAIMDGKMVYGVGNYTMGLTSNGNGSPPVWSGSQVATQVPVVWDSNCFNDLPAMDDGQSSSCAISFGASSQMAAQLSTKPIGLGLYAKYYSPVEARYVDQLIGNVTLYRDLKNDWLVAPNGIYLYGDTDRLNWNILNSLDPSRERFNVSFNDGAIGHQIRSGDMASDFIGGSYSMITHNVTGFSLGDDINYEFDVIWDGFSHTLLDTNNNYNSIDLSHFGNNSGCVIWQYPSYSMVCPVTFSVDFVDDIVHKMTCNIRVYYSSRTSIDRQYSNGNFGIEGCGEPENMSYRLDGSADSSAHALGLYVNMFN